MKIFYLSLFVLNSVLIRAQNDDEVNLFSFQTTSNTTISLTLDTLSNTVIFRNGEEKDNEVIVKDKLDDDSVIFTYSYYIRAGGVENEGLDLNYVRFVYKNVEYEIFDEYSAEGETYTVGLRVKNRISIEEYEINGLYESITGSILDFRQEGIIPTMDE